MTAVQQHASRTNESILSTAREALAFAREHDYVGYDKHDGMSSRIRQALPVEHKWVNLAFQESVKRAPVNLRPLLLVEQRPIPKGDALFALANAKLHKVTGERQYLDETRRLLDRMSTYTSNEYPGFGLGYSHALQTRSQTIPAGVPDIVATSFGVRALVEGADVGFESSNARDAATFVDAALEQEIRGETRRTAYKPEPYDSLSGVTVNANALAGRLYVDLYEQFGDERYRRIAEEFLRYVETRQQPSGGWYYTDPPEASHLSMDNYHNGFIIESLLRYHAAVDGTPFEQTLRDGLSFYRTRLFEPWGAPRWDESSAYPRDVHAAAEGVVVFTLAAEPEFARRILDWTIETLATDDGTFYYQQTPHLTKRFTLMRWSQAWMAYAMSVFLSSEVQS